MSLIISSRLFVLVRHGTRSRETFRLVLCETDKVTLCTLLERRSLEAQSCLALCEKDKFSRSALWDRQRVTLCFETDKQTIALCFLRQTKYRLVLCEKDKVSGLSLAFARELEGLIIYLFVDIFYFFWDTHTWTCPRGLASHELCCSRSF